MGEPLGIIGVFIKVYFLLSISKKKKNNINSNFIYSALICIYLPSSESPEVYKYDLT
jgi:hypothetical protein